MISLQLANDVNAPTSRKSSIFLRRIVSSMFMRVNSTCAHQVRPPPGGVPVTEGRIPAALGPSNGARTYYVDSLHNVIVGFLHNEP